MMKEQLAKIHRTQQKPEKLALAAAVVKKYVHGVEFTLQVAQDKKIGKRLFSGLEHATGAWRRARRGRGLAAAAGRLAADRAVHAELRSARKDLQQAYTRVDAKRRGRRLITSVA